MSKPTVCVDFDGTIVKHDFPRIGEPLPQAFEVLKELKAAGFSLILWTCREDDGFLINRQFLTDAIEFCKENGVEFDGHNKTPENCEFRPNGGRKAYANYYIDDRNLGGFPGWETVRAMLLEGLDITWNAEELFGTIQCNNENAETPKEDLGVDS